MCKNLEKQTKHGQEFYCKVGYKIVQSCNDKKECFHCEKYKE